MEDRSFEPSFRLLLVAKLDDNFALPTLSPKDLAHAFVAVALLSSTIKCVDEERWIRRKDPAAEFSVGNFLNDLLKTDLATALFVRNLLGNLSLETVPIASKNAKRIEKTIIDFVKPMPSPKQNEFVGTALRLMSDLFEFEHRMNLEKNAMGSHFGLSLHTTFDRLDEIFNFDYVADREMAISRDEKERLYEGSGVGVQSNYAAALIALRYLNPEKGSRFVDLGSGYGRVGLVVGLMRPDIDFIGYEYVGHRVESAALASSNLGMVGHVQFNTQDLASADFQIPVADTYYIYDSFTESTYNHVLSRLVEIAREKTITIVTKGNARQWLEAAAMKDHWNPAQQFDYGNLCFFRSH